MCVLPGIKGVLYQLHLYQCKSLSIWYPYSVKLVASPLKDMYMKARNSNNCFIIFEKLSRFVIYNIFTRRIISLNRTFL